MENTKQLRIDKFYDYEDFLESCASKAYESSIVLHDHHVIPRFIDVDKDYLNKTVRLSVDDHIKAHLMLADCFDQGSKERIGNLRSAKLLSRNSIKNTVDLSEVYKSQRGDLNSAKKPENRRKISVGLNRYFSSNKHHSKGRSYEDIYGSDAADAERKKRAKCTRTREQYLASAKKAAGKLKGRPAHNAHPVTVDGISYQSLTEAANKLGTTRFKINKYIKDKNYEI